MNIRVRTHLFCLGMICFVAACQPQTSTLHGYVEGEYIHIAATTPGILKSVMVQKGQKIKAKQSLFALDDVQLKAKIALTKAEVTQAQASLKDLSEGKRSEELRVIQAQQEQARAQWQRIQKEYKRAKQLISAKAISQAEFDEWASRQQQAQSRVEELKAQRQVAMLGGRPQALKAAQARVKIAEQKWAQAKQQLQEAVPSTPQKGVIEDVFFHPGEYVPAGAAVVSVLPTDHVKIRFFVPQNCLGLLPLGTRILVSCDGCATDVQAKVSYVSQKAEYTPPVIYSTEARKKLVFMVEASLKSHHPSLHPGLPVDIRIPTA